MNIKLKKCQAASDDGISGLEEFIGTTLPADYRAFVKSYDCAVPEDNAFKGDLDVGIARFIPVADIVNRCSKIDGFPKSAIPIAETVGGDYIYLSGDYYASVFYWDHEVDSDRLLASSFDEFLNNLESINLDSVQLQPGQSKVIWIDPDFKPEFD